MSTGEEPIEEAREPTEDELRAVYEAQIKQLRIEHLLLENVVTLVNLGMRRTGLAPGTEDERDPEQVRLAIESIRAFMPLLEQVAPSQAGPIRDALSQLQLAFVKIGGQAAGGSAGGSPGQGPGGSGGPEPGGPAGGPGDGGAPGTEQTPPAKPGEPGPAQRSGRLWVPGQ